LSAEQTGAKKIRWFKDVRGAQFQRLIEIGMSLCPQSRSSAEDHGLLSKFWHEAYGFTPAVFRLRSRINDGPATLGARQRWRMPKWFVVVSGSGIAERREAVCSATNTIRRALDLTKARRPGVRIEDEGGAPMLLSQLKVEAKAEAQAKPRKRLRKSR
jgi:hypothetical protein